MTKTKENGAEPKINLKQQDGIQGKIIYDVERITFKNRRKNEKTKENN
ncbi:MAG: hypothetical protein IJL63_02325 [Clostridia bacterium]|nr:hypothetical protein [Clostridia bacterium]